MSVVWAWGLATVGAGSHSCPRWMMALETVELEKCHLQESEPSLQGTFFFGRSHLMNPLQSGTNPNIHKREFVQ